MSVEVVASLLDVAKNLSVVGLLIVIIWSGAKPDPWWVFGSHYRDKEQECADWKDLALKNLGIAEQAAQSAHSAVDLADRVVHSPSARRRSPSGRHPDVP